MKKSPNRKAIGGRSEELGNLYRKQVASYLSIQLLLLPQEAYLEIEKNGDDIRFFDGNILYIIECKKNSPGGSWTLAKLHQEGIIEFFVTKYQENFTNQKYELVLMSSDGCAELDRLAVLAKKGEIVNEDLIKLAKDYKLPTEIDNIPDFFSHINICSISYSAINFFVSPIIQSGIDQTVIADLRSFVHEKGFYEEKITRAILEEKLPGVKNWVERNKAINKYDQEIPNTVQFFRKPMRIAEVKEKIKSLRQEFDKDKIAFENTAGRALIAYNTNIKLVLGILDLYKNDLPVTPENAGFISAQLEGNPIYQWHFFKNLTDPKWFNLIKDNLIVDIFNNQEDYSVKSLALEYLILVSEGNEEAIIPIVEKAFKHTSFDRILKGLVKLIAKINKDDNRMWNILETLALHNSSSIRQEVAESLKSLCDLDITKTLSIVENLVINPNIQPEDVITGTPTLSLKFQGKDLESHVFEETMVSLEKILFKYPLIGVQKNIKILTFYLDNEGKEFRQIGAIIDDYSYIWYSQADVSERKYEFDHKERLALEIENLLLKIPDDHAELEKVFYQLLNERYSIFYLLALKSILKRQGLSQIKKDLIFNRDLWEVYGLRAGYLQDLIKAYFIDDNNPSDDFKKAVDNFSAKNTKNEKWLKEELLMPFKTSVSEEYPKHMSNIHVSNYSPTTYDLSQTENAEIVKEIREGGRVTEGFRETDLKYNLAIFSSENPDKAFEVIKELQKDENISSEYMGKLVDGYLQAHNDDIDKAVTILSYLREKDTWAKISLARYGAEKCRTAKSFSDDIRIKLIEVLESLSKDKDPEKDNLRDSYLMDLIGSGLNSVRGLVAESAIFYLHFFPTEKRIITLIKLLAADKSLSVKACLIYQSVYVVRHKELYELIKTLVENLKLLRVTGIDVAILRYLSSLNDTQFEENEDTLLQILKNPNKELQGEIGEFLGASFVNGHIRKDLVEKILNEELGNKHTRRGLAFKFESSLPDILIKDPALRRDDVVLYLKRIIDVSKEFDVQVRERASFLFEREIDPSFIKLFLENNFFDLIGIDRYNPSAQGHAISYILKCKDSYLKEAIKALSAVVIKDSLILDDSVTIKEILSIVDNGFSREQELDDDLMFKLEKIFDYLLEKGWEESYTIFYKYLKNE